MSQKCIVFLLTVAIIHTIHPFVVSGNEDANTGSIVSSHDHDGHDHEDHGDHSSLDQHKNYDDAEHEDHEGHEYDNTTHEDHDDHDDHDHDDHDDHEDHANYTTAQKYGYGTASVLIISALAFMGLLVFPVIGTTSYTITMQFFISLGVGTMSGDALLHIVPEVVGLHAHAPGENHVEEEENKTYLWRLLVVVGGIYFFFLFESTVRLINQVHNVNITLHGTGDHDHNTETGNSRASRYTLSDAAVKWNRVEDDVSDEKMKEEINITLHEHNTGDNDCDTKTRNSGALRHTLPDSAAKSNGVEDDVLDEDEKKEKKEQKKVFGDFTTVALMVLIGDILHNFGDGLAIGVAFSVNSATGIGTSIAILCHELPHEFGDFAIYLNSGLSKCQGLLANFAAACVAFVGLYIGLAVSNNPEVRLWILSAIAGMFIYICFVDVMHEMIETKTKKPVLQFLMQNLGLLLGWAILLVIAVYEDQIIHALE